MKYCYLLVVLLLVSCGAQTPAQVGPLAWPDGVRGSAQVGQRAPNFKLSTSTGSEVQLDQLRGKPILINFFASWCHPCREEMPLLERASQTVQVVGVDLQEDGPTVSAFGQTMGVSYPLVLDSMGDVKADYRVANLPWTFALNADGIVTDVIVGPLTEAKLSAVLAKLNQ